MVRALLDGTKTQTRRVCKPAQSAGLSFVVEVPDPLERGQVYNGSHFGNEEGGVQFASPYGGVGDRLWVRETHSIAPGPHVALEPGESWGTLRWPHVTFAADGAVQQRDQRWKGVFGKSRPSIHMPRWASRIDLEIAGVRVERLQDIGESDCYAEGIRHADVWGDGTAVGFYRTLWEQINGAGSWAANPWVWVIEFRRIAS
jgi:hypothetical protein